MFEKAKLQDHLTLFLNTVMTDFEGENGTVWRIRCYQLTTETEWTLSGRIFCDCTGNGTLAWKMGASFRTGSESKAEFHEPHAPHEPDRFRMGNTLLFKAVNAGHPVTFIPPKSAYHFTEE